VDLFKFFGGRRRRFRSASFQEKWQKWCDEWCARRCAEPSIIVGTIVGDPAKAILCGMHRVANFAKHRDPGARKDFAEYNSSLHVTPA
jgi:hypothetical protein